MGEAGGTAGRYVVAAGTRRYREGRELPLAHQDADRAAELFGSMGYQRVLAGVSYDPGSGDFEDALAGWCRTAELTADDVVVLYYAGHGDRSPAGQYRLACADTEQDRPRSWLSLPHLAEILATSPVRNVLFVVDACHGAAAGADIGRVTDAIVATRPGRDSFGAGTWLLASARHRDAAYDGAFVAELVRACAEGDGPSQRYLAPGVLAERVNAAFAAAGSPQRAACSSVDHSERPPFFLNPSFDPRAEITGGEARGDVCDLSSHFEPRGRGVEHVHDPGSYFTGRERALLDARTHLAKDGVVRLLAVTADPGSGKSAVLGRLVLEGCADASVNAHHQTLEALVGRFAAAADVRAATADGLFTALASRARPFRIVVDSLDEAGSGSGSAEARRIAWELLRPLAAVPCVRLVVGTRRGLLPHLGDGVPVVDLDTDVYAGDTDTAQYVAKILGDSGAPYEHCPGIARQVAHEVARRAGRCFLVARMAASALLRGPVVDTSVPGWAGQLPSDVGGAFEAYLQRLPPERHTTTMALLKALAFGEGNGLPRRMWIRAAARLSGIPVTEADVDVLLDEDASYLADARVDGTTYFRLYHQELTDHIKSRVLLRRDLADVQECLVETLLEFVPERDWSRAHPYVRARLATHAAGAGTLDGFLQDAAFLVAADPSTLLPAVREAVRRPMLAMAVERYAYLLADADAPSPDPAALLAYVAGTYGEEELRRQAEGLARSLERIHVERRGITPHRVVGRHEGDGYASRSMSPDWKIEYLVLPGGDRVVLAAPPGASHVHVWRIDSPSQSSVLPHPARVVGLVLLGDPGSRAEAVTLDARGTLRVWNVADQTLTRTVPDTGWSLLFDAGVVPGDTHVVVCGTEEAVLVVDLDGPAPLVEVPCRTRTQYTMSATQPGLYEPGSSACLCQDAGGHTRLLVCDGADGQVTLYALDGSGGSWRVLDELVKPELADRVHRAGGTLVAVSEFETGLTVLDVGSRVVTKVPAPHVRSRFGRFAVGGTSAPVFVTEEDDHLLLIPVDGSPPVRSKSAPATPLFGVVTALVGGRAHAVISFFDRPLVVADAATGAPLGFPLLGHESAVCAVRLLERPGPASGPDILAIVNDGTVRLWPWDAHEHPPSGTEESPAQEVARTEVALLFALAADPMAVLAVRGGRLVRLEHPFPGAAGHDPRPSPHAGRVPDIFLVEQRIAEDSDGTLNLLHWQDPSQLAWTRLTSDGRSSSTVVASAEPANADLLVLPPAPGHESARFLAFARQTAAVKRLDSPAARSAWLPLPGTALPDNTAPATAFTTAAGATVLLTYGVPKQSGPHHHGLLVDVSSETPFVLGEFEVPDEVRFLLPHHARAGTRWVAQQCRRGDVSVLDVSTRRQLTVPHLPAAAGRYVPRHESGDQYAHYLRWADLPSGGPLLVALSPDTVDDAHPAPVAVWDPDSPETVDSLPVLASRILWTGAAPSGEALVAVSDELGVALCHLPSREKVWAAPLPALVTCLTALPGSPHLDLAVGTQQGVVFLRPRLSRVWRDRLGVG
ncbi:caspase family protein [Streptomyces paradoxus]|uniref:caspase family protein n=1 Tax=Streptomyces paradoxus TaxID=66375 RepID=UPI0037D8CAEB